MIKTFKYRLVPNRKQRLALERTLAACRELWNMALNQKHCQRISWAEQTRQLTVLRAECAEYQAVNRHILDNVLRRLDLAFLAFFRRLKAGQAPGFPRFRSFDRYDSFTAKEGGFWLEGRRLKISKLGSIKLRLSRALPAGFVLKQCTVRRTAGHWDACICCEVPSAPLPPSQTAIGIDVGLEHFAALSDGTFIANPRLYQHAQVKLRRAQRRLSRCKNGSNRRREIRALLEKMHEHVRNQRRDFFHKESRKLVNRFGIIVVEDLNVAGMARSNFAKQIHDAGWATWIRLLREKAAEAITRQVIAVSARGTSQTCPACGAVKKKALSERRHRCPCGFEAHRDTAAAQVIKGRAGPSGVKVGAVSPCLA